MEVLDEVLLDEVLDEEALEDNFWELPPLLPFDVLEELVSSADDVDPLSVEETAGSVSAVLPLSVGGPPSWSGAWCPSAGTVMNREKTRIIDPAICSIVPFDLPRFLPCLL
jgi:hypothetical protein